MRMTELLLVTALFTSACGGAIKPKKSGNCFHVSARGQIFVAKSVQKEREGNLRMVMEDGRTIELKSYDGFAEGRCSGLDLSGRDLDGSSLGL